MSAIGFQKLEQVDPQHRNPVPAQRLRPTPGEEVPSEAIAGHQSGAGVPHRFQALQLKGQRSGHRLSRRLFGAGGFGQQQPGLQVGQPCGHHQVFGGEFEIGASGLGDEPQILLGQLHDRDFLEIDLLLPGEHQQHVEGALVAVDVDDERSRRSVADVFGHVRYPITIRRKPSKSSRSSRAPA